MVGIVHHPVIEFTEYFDDGWQVNPVVGWIQLGYDSILDW